MIVAGAVLAAYSLVAAAVWAWVAYTMGQHYGEAHEGTRSETCQEPPCQNPVVITLFASLVWPVFFLVAFGFFWGMFWNKAGANSKLPPENGHPMTKKKDADVEFVE